MSKKIYRNKVDFSVKKVRRNDIDISYTKIMSKNVRQIDVNYSPIEITSKKYVVWKFIDIFCEVLTYYQQRIGVDLLWCGVHWVWKKERLVILKNVFAGIFFSLGIVNANNANDCKVRLRTHFYVPIFQWQILKSYASMRYLSHVRRW